MPGFPKVVGSFVPIFPEVDPGDSAAFARCHYRDLATAEACAGVVWASITPRYQKKPMASYIHWLRSWKSLLNDRGWGWGSVIGS